MALLDKDHSNLSDEELMKGFDTLPEIQPQQTQEEIDRLAAEAEARKSQANASEAVVTGGAKADAEVEVVDLDEGEQQPDKKVETPIEKKVEVPANETPEEKLARETAEAAAETPEQKATKEADKAELAVLKQKAADYDRLMAPFKAAGKDYQAKTPEEVLRLMQMGVDYNRKNESMKPYIRAGKALEAHGLLGDAQIAFAIELLNKNPQAIQKLIADSGVDVHDLDAQQAAAGYRPQVDLPSAQTMEIQEVADELVSSQHYPKLQQTVLGWDDQSKAVLAGNPSLLRVLHTHQEQGIFDEAMAEVDRLRTLGQTNGHKLIDIYDHFARQVFARKYPQAVAGAQQQQASGDGTSNTNQAAIDVAAKAEANARRAAAAPTRQTGNASEVEPDITKMTDAEIMALDLSKFKPKRG